MEALYQYSFVPFLYVLLHPYLWLSWMYRRQYLPRFEDVTNYEEKEYNLAGC